MTVDDYDMISMFILKHFAYVEILDRKLFVVG